MVNSSQSIVSRAVIQAGNDVSYKTLAEQVLHQDIVVADLHREEDFAQ